MYIRKICYLDYLEQNNRIKNAGHVKICLNENKFTIEIQVKGVPGAEQYETWIELKGMEGNLSTFQIERGSGTFRGNYDADNIKGSGTGFNDLSGIRIPLSGDRELHADFDTKKCPKKIQKDEIVNIESSITEKPENNNAGEIRENQIKELVQIRAQEKKQPETEPEPEHPAESFVADRMADRLDDSLSVDKWEQLCRTYKRVQPFGDKCYISLAPKDFIILRKEYQQLVNNSFLLHGYYNYKHLILGKEKVKNEEIFYLGVPGAYYDREKMVAVMFGFEGFEIAGDLEKDIPSIYEIPQGTFGYYMKRVEI